MVFFKTLLFFIALFLVVQDASGNILGNKENDFHVGMTFFGNKSDMGSARNGTDGFSSASVDGMHARPFDQYMMNMQRRSPSDKKKDPSCCDQYPDVEIIDNDLADFGGNVDECCDFCAGTPGCFGWTWKNISGGICFFKTTTGPGITSVGSVTGTPCENRRRARGTI
uniref:Apple domain-containing protein n=1 Tax=Panagrolaimus davidi TaxID=227884 RepID=A0A914PLG2_9BILA